METGPDPAPVYHHIKTQSRSRPGTPTPAFINQQQGSGPGGGGGGVLIQYSGAQDEPQFSVPVKF